MEYSTISTRTLLTDLRAQEQWLRDYPTHPTRKMVERECRARRRELADRGVEVEAVDIKPDQRLYLRRGYVVLLNDGTVGRNQAVHVGRDTCHVVTRFNADGYVREATEDELSNMPVCGHCLNQTGLIGVGTQPLAEPQGNSVRTVSGGAFEMNRRRH
jgi:hypothetical protein